MKFRYWVLLCVLVLGGSVYVFAQLPSSAGTTGQVQFSQFGVLNADSNFTWDNTNKRLGIAITPQVPLDLTGVFRSTNGTQDFRIQPSFTGGPAIGAFSNDNLLLTTNNTERMRILSTGSVGVGTTPAFPFHVNGSGNISAFLNSASTTNTQTAIVVGQSGANGRAATYGFTDDAGATNSFAWMTLFGDTPGTNGLSVKKGGNVGVGTGSPSVPLEVVGQIKISSGSEIPLIVNGAAGTADSGMQATNTAASGRIYNVVSTGGSSGYGAGLFVIGDNTTLANKLFLNGATGAAGITPVTFASLPAVPGAGGFIYCTNCTTAATCASGGSGHMAVSNGSSWTCQ
jgi:hypothetical protein